MTQEEATIIGRIIGTADGGCHSCIHALAERLNKAALGFTWTPTNEGLIDQPVWSDDPEDKQLIGYVVKATPA